MRQRTLTTRHAVMQWQQCAPCTIHHGATRQGATTQAGANTHARENTMPFWASWSTLGVTRPVLYIIKSPSRVTGPIYDSNHVVPTQGDTTETVAATQAYHRILAPARVGEAQFVSEVVHDNVEQVLGTRWRGRCWGRCRGCGLWVRRCWWCWWCWWWRWRGARRFCTYVSAGGSDRMRPSRAEVLYLAVADLEEVRNVLLHRLCGSRARAHACGQHTCYQAAPAHTKYS